MLSDTTNDQKLSVISAADAPLAVLAGLVGLLARLPAALRSGFPLNDGGLFYQMILEIQANHFRLPLFTAYNSEHIPFAYPPLGLYAGALLATGLRADVLEILRIVPAMVSSLSVPAFYFLARRVLKSGPYTTLAATVIFALLPRAFEWQIMGGGITRSFGFLFALLTWHAAYDLFETKAKRAILPVVAWGALTVLSHPEAAVQCLVGAVLLYLVLDRSRAGAMNALIGGLSIAAVTAPWWASVLARYGVGPFLAAISAAGQATTIGFPARIFLAFQFSFTEEPFLPLIAVLGLVGLFAQLARGKVLLPLWVVMPLFVEPRSAPQYMVVPLALLAGIGAIEVIIPAIGGLGGGQPSAAPRAARWLVAYLTLYLLLGAYLVPAGILDRATLQPTDRAAFAWVRDNTPQTSEFILLTNGNALADPWVEWFPALARRRSIDTAFGAEWLSGNSFGSRIQQYDALQSCLSKDAACLEAWKRSSGQQFDFVAVRITQESAALLQSLRGSPSYSLAYENQSFAIFANPH